MQLSALAPWHKAHKTQKTLKTSRKVAFDLVVGPVSFFSHLLSRTGTERRSIY